MKRNVEIKARMCDRASVLRTLAELGARDAGTEAQEDRFFAAPQGRLKLRRSSRDGDALLAYRRADAAVLRASEYERVPLDPQQAAATARALAAVAAPGPCVRKERHLWFLGNIRIHLDRVDGLGEFLELEAMVDAAHPEADCHRAAAALLERLGIAPEDVVPVAYADLLARAGAATDGDESESAPARVDGGGRAAYDAGS